MPLSFPILQKAGAPVDGVTEVQTVTITGSPTGGTFTLTYSGQTTAGIAYNATAAAVQTALEALSNIAVGDVAVTGAAGGPYTVTFGGSLEGLDVAEMTASAAGLTGGTSPTVTVTTSTAGVKGSFRGVTNGTLLADSTNGQLYVNDGTRALPDWNAYPISD